MSLLSTTSNDLNTSAKWDGSNETHDGYKAWVNDVSLRANHNQMAWIMKIAKRLQEAPNFRRPVSRAPREQFFDEVQAAREELIAEIQRSTETDAGEKLNLFTVGRDSSFPKKLLVGFPRMWELLQPGKPWESPSPFLHLVGTIPEERALAAAGHSQSARAQGRAAADLVRRCRAPTGSAQSNEDCSNRGAKKTLYIVDGCSLTGILFFLFPFLSLIYGSTRKKRLG